MKTMKKILTALLLLTITNSFAQNSGDCNVKFNLFYGEYKAKKYDAAYDNWKWCMDNCPKISLGLYQTGVRIVGHKLKKAQNPAEKLEMENLMNRVYKQRLENYPNRDAAKVYNDWASFKEAVKSPENEVFALLEKSFKIDPTDLSAKNIYKYFDVIMQRNKDTNPQVVFDVYDEVGEGVEKKREELSKKIQTIDAKGETATAKEKSMKVRYGRILKNLGKVETGLDAKISSISTCENLIPLNKKYFEENRNNAVWLKRAVSRMYNKECTNDPFYETLVEAYVKADPSPEASSFFAGILMRKGETSKALEYYKKAVNQETDNYKKSKLLYRVAQGMAKKGQKSQARNYANQAISYNSNLGAAYLLIGRLYASSANSCGDNLVEKRLVYVAAANKARKAMQVDPSIEGTARKDLARYVKNFPSKRELFTAEGVKSGQTYTINKCWIRETVRVP